MLACPDGAGAQRGSSAAAWEEEQLRTQAPHGGPLGLQHAAPLHRMRAMRLSPTAVAARVAAPPARSPGTVVPGPWRTCGLPALLLLLSPSTFCLVFFPTRIRPGLEEQRLGVESVPGSFLHFYIQLIHLRGWRNTKNLLYWTEFSPHPTPIISCFVHASLSRDTDKSQSRCLRGPSQRGFTSMAQDRWPTSAVSPCGQHHSTTTKLHAGMHARWSG